MCEQIGWVEMQDAQEWAAYYHDGSYLGFFFTSAEAWLAIKSYHQIQSQLKEI